MSEEATTPALPLHLVKLIGKKHRERGLIRHLRMLTADEDRAYREACNHLNDFKRSRELFPLVQLNARSCLRGAQMIVRTPREVLRDTRRREHLGREFNRLLINYLGSFRLYLDQMRTRLWRLYRVSSEFAAFEAARRHAYDTTPEYRVIYKARDFALHCGMLVPGVQFSETLVREPEQRVAHTVGLDCNRDYLLEQFGKDWKHAYEHIKEQPDSFPIHLMFVGATRALHYVDTKVTEAERPSLLASARVIVQLAAEVAPGDDEGAAVAEIHQNEPRTDIVFVHAPATVIAWVGLPYQRIAQF